MDLTDSFVALQNDIGREAFEPLEIAPGQPWLLELNIDPQDAVLEIRRYLGDPKGTCLRKDACLTVRRNDHGELAINAFEVALEDLGYWPIYSDWQARQRAKKVMLPHEPASLHSMVATEDGDAIHLKLIVTDATDTSRPAYTVQIRISVDSCTLTSVGTHETKTKIMGAQ